MGDTEAQKIAPKGWLISPQPRLGTVGLIALMVLVILTTSLASDVYTPSIPEMPAALHTTPAMVNLTLSGFILFDAVGMLIIVWVALLHSCITVVGVHEPGA